MTSFRRIWTDAAGQQTLGTDWAAEGTFAELLYSTYSEAHYAQWRATYCPDGGDSDDSWHRFGKPGMDAAAHVQDRQAAPTFVGWSEGTGPSEGEQVRLPPSIILQRRDLIRNKRL